MFAFARTLAPSVTRKGGEHRMINFDHMTAMVRAPHWRAVASVRKDAPRNAFAALDIGQQCGRSFAPGGAG